MMLSSLEPGTLPEHSSPAWLWPLSGLLQPGSFPQLLILPTCLKWNGSLLPLSPERYLP